MLRMTDETKRLLQTVGQLVPVRDAIIRRAHDEGGSLREIAKLVGLSHTEVRRILKEK
jgi:DNA invertase Pin-like site-specific DNA recombinase